MLMNGAVEIGGGNLDYRVEPLSNDEIGQLGEAFNGMAASLAEAHRANSLLVAELEARGQDLESRVEKRTEELKAAQAATLNSMQVVERANAALRQEKAFTDQVINSIPGIFYVFDQTGKFISWNDNFSKISGYSDDEIAVMHPVQLFRGEDQERVAARIQKVFEDGVADVEADLTTKSGQGIPYFFTGLRTIIEGEPTLIGTGFDITDRKRAETELKKSMDALSRSNAELERFAYVASHDLQEPLRMVTSYLQLLERRYKDRLDGDALEFIAYAVDGSNRMKTLINDLLAYSRMGTRGKEFAPTDCEGVLARVLKNLEVAIAETKASITHDPLPQVLGDDVQLESLLQNLIGNSLKFRGKQKPKIHIGAEQDGDRWVFSVRDNGIGIDPQYFERIFIIFQRLHNREEYSGTGIGLAISKRIVERHGGRIRLESKPGEGSTFRFTLRAAQEKKP
jgi:PAS domain S-box-containing protein